VPPQIDLQEAINAVSDVIQNRPRPLREFDQIYMRAGDMVLQSEFVAHWADSKSLAFVGDGDGISVCVAYLAARKILDYGPSDTIVFDFDQRMVNAINRFADRERLDTLSAVLYNCLDPLPEAGPYDAFYTNPPWGKSNGGQSVSVFVQRGMELVEHNGEGVVVIADRDENLPWTEEVLANVQLDALSRGFYVSRLMQNMHSYHLDDNPELRSCNLLLRSRPSCERSSDSIAIDDPTRLTNFYGDGLSPEVRYVMERRRVDYGKANDNEYELEMIPGVQ
jgi:predicted methyltransferase